MILVCEQTRVASVEKAINSNNTNTKLCILCTSEQADSSAVTIVHTINPWLIPLADGSHQPHHAYIVSTIVGVLHLAGNLLSALLSHSSHTPDLGAQHSDVSSGHVPMPVGGVLLGQACILLTCMPGRPPRPRLLLLGQLGVSVMGLLALLVVCTAQALGQVQQEVGQGQTAATQVPAQTQAQVLTALHGLPPELQGQLWWLVTPLALVGAHVWLCSMATCHMPTSQLVCRLRCHVMMWLVCSAICGMIVCYGMISTPGIHECMKWVLVL